jgi:Uncharacterised nucleotidyltransferase
LIWPAAASTVAAMPAALPESAIERAEQLKLWLISAMLVPAVREMPDPGFSTSDWLTIDSCAAQHRLRPLLFHNLRHRWSDWSVPDSVRRGWEASYARAGQRALNRQAATIAIARVLDGRAIPSAVLKGGALDRHYGSPLLRPMRDIDVLVPRDRAEEAFSAMLEAGFVRRADQSGPVQVDYGHHKHLEALWCPMRRVALEIHTSLVDKARGEQADDILLQIETLLSGRRFETIGSAQIPVLGWAETLLHLIVHAVYDHQLNNGPLVLSDCAAMAGDPEADWDRFWDLATRSGRAGGAQLIFRIMRLCAPMLPAIPEPADLADQADPAIVRQSALLMLQDTSNADVQGGWDRLFAQGSLIGSLRTARDRALMRQRTAHAHGAEGSGNLALAWQMFRGLLKPAQRREIARSRAVFGWLEQRR